MNTRCDLLIVWWAPTALRDRCETVDGFSHVLHSYAATLTEMTRVASGAVVTIDCYNTPSTMSRRSRSVLAAQGHAWTAPNWSTSSPTGSGKMMTSRRCQPWVQTCISDAD